MWLTTESLYQMLWRSFYRSLAWWMIPAAIFGAGFLAGWMFHP
jgi:hypothetical protein